MAKFKEWLKQKGYDKKLSSETSFSRATGNLEAIVRDFDDFLKSRGVRATLEEGWVVELGQQYRLKLKLVNQDYEHVMFRAYVNPEGVISFDFYDESPVECDGTDADDVVQTVGAFLQRNSSLSTVQQLLKIAAAGKTPKKQGKNE